MNYKTKYLKSKNKSGKGTETRGRKAKPQGKRTINSTGEESGTGEELRNGTGIEERNGSKRKNGGNKDGDFFWTNSTDGAGRRMAKQTRKERTN